MKKTLVLVILTLGVVAEAQTYTESILYNFATLTSPGSLVRDSAGNLYGAAYYGGGYETCSYGCGTLFKLSSSGRLTTLYAFTGGSDGSNPCCLAIDTSGNLYGTAENGGLGYGTVFTFSTTKKFSTLHEFGRTPTDGLYPAGPLTIGSDGNLYGMTLLGGTGSGCGPAPGCGTIVEVTPKGKESVVYNFTLDSAGPHYTGNILRDSKGNFYGEGYCSLFEVSSKGVWSALSDSLCDDIYDIVGPIARSATGNFYGAYQDSGGANDPNGLWEVSGISHALSFYDELDPASASGPLEFSGGNLYGTVYQGGLYGNGYVWEFVPSTLVETNVYNFGGYSTDGSNPEGGVIPDSKGNFYGTTPGGGTYGYGTLFKLTKN